MKKFLLKVTSGPEYSFSYSNEECPHFYDEFHYHPEIELTLITKGEGTRFVGDNIERFHDEDLVLVGSNLPHVWKNDDAYYSKESSLKANSVVIHFHPDFLGREFFDLPETASIRNLLQKASAGLALNGNVKRSVSSAMKRMAKQGNFERLITLISILRDISLSVEVRTLASPAMVDAYKLHESDRMKKIHQYIITNFKNEIRLEDVARIANMTPTAFSRYFKQRTRKTFSFFLNEVRIGYACQLLIENRLKIGQICYESGFTNLSNFNVQFKAIVKKTPQQYLKSTLAVKADY